MPTVGGVTSRVIVFVSEVAILDARSVTVAVKLCAVSVKPVVFTFPLKVPLAAQVPDPAIVPSIFIVTV